MGVDGVSLYSGCEEIVRGDVDEKKSAGEEGGKRRR